VYQEIPGNLPNGRGITLSLSFLYRLGNFVFIVEKCGEEREFLAEFLSNLLHNDLTTHILGGHGYLAYCR
jgi:hypothetical protein